MTRNKKEASEIPVWIKKEFEDAGVLDLRSRIIYLAERMGIISIEHPLGRGHVDLSDSFSLRETPDENLKPVYFDLLRKYQDYVS